LFFDNSSPAGLSGLSLQADLGWRISPVYVVYGFVEDGLYDDRSDRIAPGAAASSPALGAGVQATTNPQGPVSFLVDLSFAYRWLRVPFLTGIASTPACVDRYRGWEPLRLRAGPTLLLSDHWRIGLLLGGQMGRFVGQGHKETCAITASCSDSILVDSDTQSATYMGFDAAFALQSWF
jgi:hypothetical protein